MKKFVAVLLVMIMLCSCLLSVSADEYVIHSGVTFGMSKDEVKALETEAGFTVKENAKQAIINSCPSHRGNNLSLDGTIAGFSGANICYHFNQENVLESAIYLLAASKQRGGCDYDYNGTVELLGNKYGKSDETAKTVIETGFLECCLVDSFSEKNGDSSIYNITIKNSEAFTYLQEDGSIIIIYIAVARVVIAGQYLMDILYINYQLYSGERYETAVENAREGINDFTNQIYGDL